MQTDFSLLSSNFVTAVTTFMILNSEEKPADDVPSYGWSLWTNALLNSFFALFLWFLMTGKADEYETATLVLLVFTMCWMIAQIIINIVVVCKNGSEYQPVPFYWTIGQIFFLILLVLNVFYQKNKE